MNLVYHMAEQPAGLRVGLRHVGVPPKVHSMVMQHTAALEVLEEEAKVLDHLCIGIDDSYHEREENGMYILYFAHLAAHALEKVRLYRSLIGEIAQIT